MAAAWLPFGAGSGRLARRGVTLLGVLAWAAALGGCAWLGQASPGPVGALTAATALPPPTLQVDIELPADIPQAVSDLLRRHLDLARLVELSRGTALSETELDRLIAATPAQAASLLATEGYFQPRVVVNRMPASSATDPGLRMGSRDSRNPISSVPPPVGPLKVRIDPGPRTTVVAVDLSTTGPLQQAVESADKDARQDLALWRARWPLKPGAVFRNEDWNEAKSQALLALQAAGYASATWRKTSAEVDPGRSEARLTLVVDSGPLFRTGTVKIEGLALHRPQTVFNLAGFTAGARATDSLLLDFQDRLLKSGLFERASVTLDAVDVASAPTDPSRASAVTVRVEVAEAPRQELTLGLGVSAKTGQRATAEHVDRRAFGLAATARNQVEWARIRRAWEGEISTHPGAAMERWLGGAAVERLEASADEVLSQRLRLGRAQDTVRADSQTFVQIDRSVRTTATAKNQAVATSANQHWTWRQVDNPVLPTNGYTAALQVAAGQASGENNSRGGFTRVWSRVQWFRPVGRDWYAQARLEAGQVLGATLLQVPDALLFRAGGDDSVRGYGYRSLGPVVGTAVGSGRAVATSSIEMARPISKDLPQFWGAAFVDAGRAADTFSDLKPAVGYGVGLRWRSPVGPLRLDIARGRETRENRLHFSLGIAF